MRTETCIITVYADPDTCQNVKVQYVIESGLERNWLLTSVKVLDPITIEPDELQTDIIEGIAFEENIPGWRLDLDCTIECTITAEQYAIH